ncbi:hypothetical protein PUN28_004993 [Cardiocondyla obscurior]|uniref:Tower domain-containing protein n=1 Tax=Cardiocondyla obscurior TaxID=286306 RepID=A0AAW2GI61_9HYME
MSNATKLDNVNLPETDSAEEDESDDLFSDDEPEIIRKPNVSLDTSALLRSGTPSALFDNPDTIMPTDAVIPSTPLSLMPFLNKINDQWTSDLETPQAEAWKNQVTTSTGRTETTPRVEQRTPDVSTVKTVDKIISESPVIACKATRRRSKRRIFRSFTPIDPVTVTNNEDDTVSAQEETPTTSEANFVERHSLDSSFGTTRDDYEPKDSVKDQHPCNNENSEMNAASDNLNTSTQEFFNNASFSKIDELCTKTFDNLKTIETAAVQHSNERSIEDIGKERNIEANKSISFFTACGTAINVSKHALCKAKRLFADTLDTDEMENFDSFVKRNFNEEKSRHLPSTSFASNVSASIAKEALPVSRMSTEQSGIYDKICTAGCKETIINKTPNEGVNKVPILFSTASGNPINISREALLKAKTLLASELDEVDNESVKYYERSTDKNSLTVKNVAKTRTFAEQSDTTVAFTSRNKINISDVSDNKQCNINVVRNTPINSGQINFKTGTLLAKQLNNSSEPIVAKNIHSSEKEMKKQETNVSKIGFFTAGGKAINISEQALSKAKAALTEYLDDRENFAEETTFSDNEKLEVEMANIIFQSIDDIPICKEKPIEKMSFIQSNRREPVVAGTNKINDAIEIRREIKNQSIGFQTAYGAPIEISAQALSRARELFADELNCPSGMDIPENTGGDDGRKIKTCDLTTQPRGELQTASGQRVPVSNNAALIAQELFFDDRLDESNSDLGRASLQKRKLSETNVDESTPQGRNCTSGAKKARFGGEFQARKLFADNSSVDNDENRDLEEGTHLVADFALTPPKKDAAESDESDVACSPVIGRQVSFLRKQKSSGYQKSARSTLRADKKILNKEITELHENVAQERASCGKIGDDKLNIKMQKPTLVAREQVRDSNMESTYGDTQLMIDFVDQSTKILHDRLAAASEQDAEIAAKKRRETKQSMGCVYRCRQINSIARLSLRKISGDAPPMPRRREELDDPQILKITATNAVTYRFCCADFYGDDVAFNNVHGIKMPDGGRLILDENGFAGVCELQRAFLASPGVDPNLVPARWLENHYRWIVWKLASMDRLKFGSAELPRALTPSNVMAQLKYRYDREIDRSQRPAIRRILEKDDVASKTLILCVSLIVENNNVSFETGKSPRMGVPKWKIELTDGWYGINGCIDIGMVKNISTGKVREGTKLVVSGAELLNCDQGFHPLEAPADVCLKLHTNSTRRARWDAKLGYVLRTEPISIKLGNVCPSGGLISKLTIVVSRVYPMLYHEKTASGDSIIRNAKSEEKAQRKHEQQCLSKIEDIYADVEDFQGKGLSCEDDDVAILLSEDYESLSTKRRNEMLQELREREERFKQRVQTKMRKILPGPRQVSQLLKVRVCDENTNAILSVWSPNEEVVDALKEGACVSLYNVVASGKRGTELQLTARRSAIFKPGKMRDTSYPARVCTSLCEIAHSEFAPEYGEFDTVGLICSVGPAPYGMKDFEAVHLAHYKADSSNASYLTILFWQGIASYGYAEILTVGSIVACSNLDWRRATSWNVPAAYCTERSVFTCNPRRYHLYKSFENLRNLITDPTKHVEKCIPELNVELQKKSTPTRYMAGKNTPIKMYSSTSSVDKKLANYTSPLATPKLGAGDSSSSITSNSSIQKRYKKLEYYGEAPKLSPITLKNSKRISLDFRSPVANASPKETSINEPEKLNLYNTAEKH